MERKVLAIFSLLSISSAQNSIPFNFIPWTRAFRDCSLHLMLAEQVNLDTLPFQAMEQPYQLVRITQQFLEKDIHEGPPYTHHIQCKASFIYEVTTNHLELGLAGSLNFGGPLVKYIFLLTQRPKVVVGSVVRKLYGDPDLLIDFTRLYVLRVDQARSIKTGFLRVQVFTVCPHEARTVQVCPVETATLAVADLEFERRGRMKEIPYCPLAMVPHHGRTFYDSVWTDFGSDNVDVKVNKEMLRSIHLGFSNQSIDYHVSRKTLAPAQLSRRSRIYRGELRLTPGAAMFIPTHQQAFGFITCYEQSDQIAFHVYLEPFTWPVWLSTGLTSALLAFVLVKMFRAGSKFLIVYVNLILALMDQYSELKGSGIKQKYVQKWKAVLLGLWLVAALTLSNAYRGILTANVAAPVPTIGIETFEQLHAQGFELYSPLPISIRVYASSPRLWKLVLEKFREVIGERSNDSSGLAVGLTVFGTELKVRRASIQHSKHVDYLHAKNLWKDAYDQYLKMLRLPKDFPNVTIEQVVSSCRKSAYVDYVHELSDFEPALGLSGKWRNPNGDIKFRFGSEQLLNEQQGWLFAQDFKGGGLLSSAFRRLSAEAGIYAALLKRFKVMRRASLGYLLGVAGTNCSPIPLDSNLVQGLFILYGILLLAACIAFVVELSAYGVVRVCHRRRNGFNKA